MLSISFKTPEQVMLDLASKAKKQRLRLNFTQEGLAERSGVSLGSVKRFERTGQIALLALLKIAVVLEKLSAFEKLFESHKTLSLKDILKKEKPERKKGLIK